MKQHLVSASLPTLILSIFIFFLLLKGSYCVDPSYEACVPTNCGDRLEISFPFSIQGLQSSFCGHPSFQLHCNNGSSVLQLSGNDYLVKNIYLQKSSMRLIINAPTTTCLPVVRNLTFDSNLFQLQNDSISELVFLTNCSDQLPENLTRYRIESCDPDIELVMLENDGNLETGKEFCSGMVVAPVERQGGDGRSEVVDGGNYAEVVKRGFIARWFGFSCDVCGRSGGRCGFDTTSDEFRCFCPDRPHMVRCRIGRNKKLRRNKKLVISITALTIGVVTIMGVIVLCIQRIFKWRVRTENHVNVECFLKNHEFLAPKRYSYSSVKKMTNSFKIKLGQGGFGSVYRGVLSNGNLVAVKVLSELKGNGEDFINEVASIGKTSHVNIVSLVGFCFEGHQRALIYEFMPNGSLEKFIYDQASSSNRELGWEKLQQIAIGIARGLEYLHTGCNTRILHFDIKPHNILLDQDFCPKISDFGMAKISPEKISVMTMSHMRGTPGYIAPEVFFRNFGGVSHKSDVYSYGMMILEMVGGRRNNEVGIDQVSETYFPQWVYKNLELNEELGLNGIVSENEKEMARKMIIVGLWCIQINPLDRPTIGKVLEMLEEDVASSEIPPKPYLCSP